MIVNLAIGPVVALTVGVGPAPAELPFPTQLAWQRLLAAAGSARRCLPPQRPEAPPVIDMGGIVVRSWKEVTDDAQTIRAVEKNQGI